MLGEAFGPRREKTIDGNDFLVFNQQFNTLIKAGIPILRALDLLAERAAAEKLRPVLGEVRRMVREGSPLSEALEKQGVFPKVYTVSVLAGEKSGNLSGVLDYYVAYQRVTTGLKKKLISTLIYPVILVCASVLIVSYLVGSVIPKFAQLYSDLNINLPEATRILLAVTVTYRSFLLGAVGLVVIFAVGAFAYSRSDQGGLAIERLRMKLPLVGDTLTKFQFAQFCRTLSTLLAGGTPLVQAMETAGGAIKGRLVSGAIAKGAQLVREGQSLHNGLESTGLVPDLALDMIEVGEASGALAPMLGSVAEFYEEEVNNQLTNLIALVEPAILVFHGGFDPFHSAGAVSSDVFDVHRQSGTGIISHEHNRSEYSHNRRSAERTGEVPAPGGTLPLPVRRFAGAAHRSGIVPQHSRGPDVPVQLRAHRGAERRAGHRRCRTQPGAAQRRIAAAAGKEIDSESRDADADRRSAEAHRAVPARAGPGHRSVHADRGRGRRGKRRQYFRRQPDAGIGRQPGGPPGGHGDLHGPGAPRLGHPHRSARHRSRRQVPHRRRAGLRHGADLQGLALDDYFPHKSNERTGHRRAARAAGRPLPRALQGPLRRFPRFHHALQPRRRRRAARPGQGNAVGKILTT